MSDLVFKVALPMWGNTTQLSSISRGLFKGIGSGSVTSNPAPHMTLFFKALKEVSGINVMKEMSSIINNY